MWKILISTLLVFAFCIETFSNEKCFTQITGRIEDTIANAEDVESLNNLLILPRIKSLLNTEYFRLFKVTLNKPCQFWEDDSRCALSDCHVKNCGNDDIPKGLREFEETFSSINDGKQKYTKELNIEPRKDCSEEEKRNEYLSSLDRTISDDRRAKIDTWTRHDNFDDSAFCELDDEQNGQSVYVDLLKNPERFTGYQGKSAIRVWNSIYNENCFNNDFQTYGGGMPLHSNRQCLEKRAFYRMVSGLHTSINIHLCRLYPQTGVGASLKIGTAPSHMPLSPSKASDVNDPNDIAWGWNLEEFRSRFDPSKEPQGVVRLRNLFFPYLVELRAIAKAAPLLRRLSYFTGDDVVDRDTQQAMASLLDVVEKEGNLFDETELFRGDPREVGLLRLQFRDHFRNISRIMDCVGCDKCKLWGKLQTQGMGTALKILFSGNNDNLRGVEHLQLRRTEVVALINAFGRLSHSIASLNWYREAVRAKGGQI